MICPICKSSGTTIFEQSDLFQQVLPAVRHTLFFCDPCDLFFLNEISEDELSAYYPDRYYQRKPSVFNRFRNRLRARSVVGRKRSGTLLDVGCGRGELLRELKRMGWHVHGTEFTPSSAQRVLESLKIPVFTGKTAFDTIPNDSMDVVSMIHVLEHVSDPICLLQKVHRILKPGGRLVVGIPNSNCVERKLLGRFWMGYDIPRHRTVFSLQSLRHCLQSTGFDFQAATGRISDELLSLHGSCRLWWRSERSLKTAFLLPVVAARILFGSILWPGPGSVLYAYVTKR